MYVYTHTHMFSCAFSNILCYSSFLPFSPSLPPYLVRPHINFSALPRTCVSPSPSLEIPSPRWCFPGFCGYFRLLKLRFPYKEERIVFAFLGLADLTRNIFPLLPLACKFHGFLFLCSWNECHRVYVSHFRYLVISKWTSRLLLFPNYYS